MPARVLILCDLPVCDGGKAIVNQVRGSDNVPVSSLRAPTRPESLITSYTIGLKGLELLSHP
jgi:hypothetical protein